MANSNPELYTRFESGAQRVEEAIPSYAQIPPCSLRRLAMIFAEGEIKYGRDNWKKGLPWYSTYNHMMNHLQKYHEGDRSEDHLGKVMWGAAAQMYFEEVGLVPPIKSDDINAETDESRNLAYAAVKGFYGPPPYLQEAPDANSFETGRLPYDRELASTKPARELYTSPIETDPNKRRLYETEGDRIDRINRQTEEIMGRASAATDHNALSTVSDVREDVPFTPEKIKETMQHILIKPGGTVQLGSHVIKNKGTSDVYLGNEYRGAPVHHDIPAVSDFHEPRTAVVAERELLERGVHHAAENLHYGQGVMRLREATEHLIQFEARLSKLEDRKR